MADVFVCAMLTLVLMLAAPSVFAEDKRDKTMPSEVPAHTHLKYYGYSLVGEFDDYREELKELATFTNLITFSAHEIAPAKLEGLSPAERKERFAQAAEKIRFANSLGLKVCFVNMAGQLMRLEGSREPWLSWLRELRETMAEEMDGLYAFYILDEPDLNDITPGQLGAWIDEFKSVFPGVRCASTYALVSWSENMTPPDNLDVVAIDPYIGFPVTDPAYDFVSQYNERFHQALDWVKQADRSAVMVGDAYVGRHPKANNPMPTLHGSLWFLYTALADKNFEALVWFYYGRHVDDENLDGMRLGAFPETERVHRAIGRALLQWEKPTL